VSIHTTNVFNPHSPDEPAMVTELLILFVFDLTHEVEDSLAAVAGFP
jgi:hypothetical protein